MAIDPTTGQEVTQQPQFDEAKTSYLQNLSQAYDKAFETGDYNVLNQALQQGVGYRTGLYQFGQQSGSNTFDQAATTALNELSQFRKSQGLNEVNLGYPTKGDEVYSIWKQLSRKASDRQLSSTTGRLQLALQAQQQLAQNRAQAAQSTKEVNSLDDLAGKTFIAARSDGTNRSFKVQGVEAKQKPTGTEYYVTWVNEKGDTRRESLDSFRQLTGVNIKNISGQNVASYQSGPSAYADLSTGKQIIGRGDAGFGDYSKLAEQAGDAIRVAQQTGDTSQLQALQQQLSTVQNPQLQQQIGNLIQQSGVQVPVQAATAGRVDEGMQGATGTPMDPFTGMTRISDPSQLAGLTEDQIVRDPNSNAIYLKPAVTAETPLPTQPQVVDGVSYLPSLSQQQIAGIQNLVASGKTFNETDAKNFAYATGRTDWQTFVGKTGEQAAALTQVTAAKNLTEITDATPRFQLRDITSNIAKTNPQQPADETYIMSAFRALHGRDANAQELANFGGKPAGEVYAAILAGVPTGTKNKTLSELSREIERTDTRIDPSAGADGGISVRNTPGDLLAEMGDAFANEALTEIEKLMMKFYQGDATNIQERLGKARADEEGLKDELRGIKDSNYLETRAKELFQDGRIESLFNFLEAQRGRIENEILSKDLGLTKMGDQPIAATIILGQQRVLQEQATARIGALTAASNAALGELDRAIQVSDRVMSAIKADRENQIDALYELLDLANKDRIQLEQDERDNIDAQINLLQDANDRMADEKKDLQNLILDNPLLASAAGVSLTDSYDEAVAKIQAGVADKSSEVYRMLIASTKKTGSGGGSGSKSPDTSFLDPYLKFDEASGLWGIDIDTIQDILSSGDRQKIYEAAYLEAAKRNQEAAGQADTTVTPSVETRPPGDYEDMSIAPVSEPKPRLEAAQTIIEKGAFPFIGGIQGIQDATSRIWNWLNESQ